MNLVFEIVNPRDGQFYLLNYCWLVAVMLVFFFVDEILVVFSPSGILLIFAVGAFQIIFFQFLLILLPFPVFVLTGIFPVLVLTGIFSISLQAASMHYINKIRAANFGNSTREIFKEWFVLMLNLHKTQDF